MQIIEISYFDLDNLLKAWTAIHVIVFFMVLNVTPSSTIWLDRVQSNTSKDNVAIPDTDSMLLT